VYTFIPNCQFENVFSAYFGVEISQQNFHVVFREFVEYTFQFLIEAVFHIISFILCWGMNIQNNMKPVTSQYYVWHPIINKLNPLNCWYDSLMYERPCTQIHGSHFPFHRKMCILLLVWCHCPPIWPPALPLNLTYIWIDPSKLIREPTLYRLLMFYVPNLVSIFLRLGHLSKESVHPTCY
jgi:hypothetical protein